jgi:2-haloacid dehalogenase
MIDAIVLDIGNVLIGWDPEAFYDRMIGQERRARLFEEVPLVDMNRRIDLGAPFLKTVTKMAEAHPAWHDEVMLWHDDWLGMTAPGDARTVALMRAIRAKNIPVWALSNFGIETLAIADVEYPFLTEFDRRIVSGELGVTKPDPEIYEAVEAQGVIPEHLLYADDNQANVDAASERGWRTHLFIGVEGWATRLVAEGILTDAEAA